MGEKTGEFEKFGQCTNASIVDVVDGTCQGGVIGTCDGVMSSCLSFQSLNSGGCEFGDANDVFATSFFAFSEYMKANSVETLVNDGCVDGGVEINDDSGILKFTDCITGEPLDGYKFTGEGKSDASWDFSVFGDCRDVTSKGGLILDECHGMLSGKCYGKEASCYTLKSNDSCRCIKSRNEKVVYSYMSLILFFEQIEGPPEDVNCPGGGSIKVVLSAQDGDIEGIEFDSCKISDGLLFHGQTNSGDVATFGTFGLCKNVTMAVGGAEQTMFTATCDDGGPFSCKLTGANDEIACIVQ